MEIPQPRQGVQGRCDFQIDVISVFKGLVRSIIKKMRRDQPVDSPLNQLFCLLRDAIQNLSLVFATRGNRPIDDLLESLMSLETARPDTPDVMRRCLTLMYEHIRRYSAYRTSYVQVLIAVCNVYELVEHRHHHTDNFDDFMEMCDQSVQVFHNSMRVMIGYIQIQLTETTSIPVAESCSQIDCLQPN